MLCDVLSLGPLTVAPVRLFSSSSSLPPHSLSPPNPPYSSSRFPSPYSSSPSSYPSSSSPHSFSSSTTPASPYSSSSFPSLSPPSSSPPPCALFVFSSLPSSSSSSYSHVVCPTHRQALHGWWERLKFKAKIVNAWINSFFFTNRRWNIPTFRPNLPLPFTDSFTPWSWKWHVSPKC